MTPASAIVAQLDAAGVLPFVRSLTTQEGTTDHGAHVGGMLDTFRAINYLVRHPRFKEAPAQLHAEVGFPRIEFRSHGGAFGSGSLQVVIGPTGKFYADLDRWNPLESVEDCVKHNLFEVWWPKWLRRKS